MKKLVCLICTFIMVVCVSCSQSGPLGGEESSERDSLLLGIIEEESELSELELFLRVVKLAEEAQSFYTVTEGRVETLGIIQEIRAERYVSGDKMFKQSVSCSAFVKVATQVLVANGKYLIREGKKISGVNQVEWDDFAIDVGQTEYLNRYGSVTLGLNNYLLTEQTVTSISLVKQNGYRFTVALDVNTATVNMVKEMKTNAGSKEEPSFASIKMTVETDDSLQVVSVRYESVYTVKVAFFGEVECSEDMTESYYAFGEELEFPESEFFDRYV